MKNFKILIIFLVVGFFMFKCSNNSTDDLIDQSNIPTVVKYSTDVKPIIESSCLKCHGTPLANGAPNSLTTIEQVKFSIEKLKLIERINDIAEPMPPSGLMQPSKRAIIEKWKTDGYQN